MVYVDDSKGPATSEQIGKLLELTEAGAIQKQYFKKLTIGEADNIIAAANTPKKAGFEAPTYTPPHQVNQLNMVRLGMCFKLVYGQRQQAMVTQKQIKSFKTEVKNLYEINSIIELEMAHELGGQ